jgi:hypothetical protein
MRYFLPDSSDLVDPTFDFATEKRSATRVRQRDDLYIHEVIEPVPVDGILVSKGIVEGFDSASRYTIPQRQRLAREGVREFFRLDRTAGKRIETMGDCGAFSYVREKAPPFSVTEVLDFYSEYGFDCGISVDHIILNYKAHMDEGLPGIDLPPTEWRDRRELTIELASQFLIEHRKRKDSFKPIGVAQGWSPKSYRLSVKELQKMGYKRIAIGGVVPLKTHEIMEVMSEIAKERKAAVEFHLLGVTRIGEMERLSQHGVTSFDSTSALRQAFKDETDNYHTLERTFIAVRVPPLEGNAKIQRAITSGQIEQGQARKLEREVLNLISSFDRDETSPEMVVQAISDYYDVLGFPKKHLDKYREVLTERPWRSCECSICKSLGVHVILFRGAERNRRRGFHNIHVLYQRIQKERKRLGIDS